MILYKQGELLYLVPQDKTEIVILNKITKHFNKIPPYQLLPMYPGIPLFMVRRATWRVFSGLIAMTAVIASTRHM